ncbi:MAG TPA: hypothetical protein VK673_07110 [Chthoniobacterales bacterium]|nr:hypothetical protein [Chthoniobacterales bacterium]
MRNKIRLLVFAGLAVLATAAAGQQPNGDIQREKMTERAEEDAQTQKNADFTGGQRSALESELKNAQDRAQLAEKIADLAKSQQRALETELRKAEDRAQLAEKMADLATSQRGALETELKNAEDRAQLAEKNADLATSQRTELEAELKKAQEKAQLAQKITDLVTDQSHAEENGLPNGGAPQKSADLSANRPNSAGQTEPPNEAVPSTQPVDSSVQSAQTTTRSGPAQVRFQAVADTPREANKGTGFTEETALIGIGASPTPIGQPAAADQEGKFAQTTTGQAALPLPTLSVAVPAESISPDPQANGSSKASSDERLIKKFVLDYLQTVSSDDVSKQENFFAHSVAYYDQGVISLRRVQEALESYDREWPTRDWKPQGEPEIRVSADPRLYEVLQPFSWTLSNGPRHALGSAALYVKLWKNDKGEFHIIHVERRRPDSESQNN